MLSINNLTVSIGDKTILDGLNLEIGNGEVHAIMGLNGTGKSTLLKAIAGSNEILCNGTLEYKGYSLLPLRADERAVQGIFMSFQNPIEIPGVSMIYFLRTALNQQHRIRGEAELSMSQFIKKVQEIMEFLDMDESFLQRSVNVGFSGGEKKKSELLQMIMLEPKLILLDEIDSGLDIDALKDVARGINKLRNKETSIVIVTHYNRLLEYVKPDFVHILDHGKIVKSGNASLAKALEEKGYEDVLASS